jgi:hypothetical protein
MSPVLQLWSTATLILATMMFISAWLTGGGIPFAFGRFALAATASACLLLVIRRWWHKEVGGRLKPLMRTLSAGAPSNNNDVGTTIRGNEISRLESLVHRVCSGRAQNREAGPDLRPELAAGSFCPELSGNLRLAADHLESIKTLLEVSQSHQQPIPRAAFQNLELVSKNLRDHERQTGAGAHDTALDSALQFR